MKIQVDSSDFCVVAFFKEILKDNLRHCLIHGLTVCVTVYWKTN